MSLAELILKRLEISSLLENATEQSCAESLVAEISAIDSQIDEIVLCSGGCGSDRQRTNLGAAIVEAPRMAFATVSLQHSSAEGSASQRGREPQPQTSAAAAASGSTTSSAIKEKNVVDCLRPAPAPDQWSVDAVQRMRTYPLR